ncbi:hypothetical protein MTO96_003128 [Rhipicephalus appendiculatus]
MAFKTEALPDCVQLSLVTLSGCQNQRRSLDLRGPVNYTGDSNGAAASALGASAGPADTHFLLSPLWRRRGGIDPAVDRRPPRRRPEAPPRPGRRRPSIDPGPTLRRRLHSPAALRTDTLLLRLHWISMSAVFSCPSTRPSEIRQSAGSRGTNSFGTNSVTLQ